MFRIALTLAAVVLAAVVALAAAPAAHAKDWTCTAKPNPILQGTSTLLEVTGEAGWDIDASEVAKVPKLPEGVTVTQLEPGVHRLLSTKVEGAAAAEEVVVRLRLTLSKGKQTKEKLVDCKVRILHPGTASMACQGGGVIEPGGTASFKVVRTGAPGAEGKFDESFTWEALPPPDVAVKPAKGDQGTPDFTATPDKDVELDEPILIPVRIEYVATRKADKAKARAGGLIECTFTVRKKEERRERVRRVAGLRLTSVAIRLEPADPRVAEVALPRGLRIRALDRDGDLETEMLLLDLTGGGAWDAGLVDVDRNGAADAVWRDVSRDGAPQPAEIAAAGNVRGSFDLDRDGKLDFALRGPRAVWIDLDGDGAIGPNEQRPLQEINKPFLMRIDEVFNLGGRVPEQPGPVPQPPVAQLPIVKPPVVQPPAVQPPAQPVQVLVGQCWRDGALVFEQTFDPGDPELPRKTQAFHDACLGAGGASKFFLAER